MNLKSFMKKLLKILLSSIGFELKREISPYKTFKKEKKQNIKFDFIIFGTGRTGSKAIQSYLNIHEQIYTISRKELDKAIYHKKNGLLHLRDDYENKLIWLKENNIKSVLVVHQFIGIYTKEKISQISKICENAILITRNPYDVINSCYNHLWYYSLNPIAYDIKGWDFNNKDFKINNNRFNSKTYKFHKNSMKQQVAIMNYFYITKMLQKYFKITHVLDFEITKSANGIQSLFSLIGVDSFYHESFNESQNGHLERYFRLNRFEFLFFNIFKLTCRFDIRSNPISSNDEKEWVPIMKFDIDYKIKQKIKVENVWLMCPSDELSQVKLEDRNLLKDKYLDKNLFKDLFVEMIEKIFEIENMMAKIIKKEFYENYYEKFNSQSSEDLIKFVDNYPQFKSYLKEY